MSWAISGIGKASAVAAKLAVDFTKYPCAEPEETIRQAVGRVIATALASFPANIAVKVECSGSQSKVSQDATEATNGLRVLIEPINGFVE